MRRKFEQCPLHLVKSTDIKKNVVAALEARAESLAAALRERAGTIEQFQEWANWSLLPGTDNYHKFVNGRDGYMSFVFRKE